MAKHTTDEMNVLLDDAEKRIPLDSRWLHRGGGHYRVVGYYIDTREGEVGISYKRYDGPNFDAVKESRIVFGRVISEWVDGRMTRLD